RARAVAAVARPAIVGNADLNAGLGANFRNHVERRRLGAEDREADAADDAVRGIRETAAGELRPRLAGVKGLPHAAARTAAVEAPPRAAPLIRRGVQNLRVHRIDRDVVEA